MDSPAYFPSTEDADEILKLTTNLCQIPSQSDDIKTNLQCFDFIRNYLSSSKWNVDVIQSKHPALYISSQNQSSSQRPYHSKVLHLCHTDVVPADKYECSIDTSQSPKKILRGRGVSDMKGPVACILHMLSQIKEPSMYDLSVLSKLCHVCVLLLLIGITDGSGIFSCIR